MRKRMICVACLLAACLAGCVPKDLPAGDRDEIGASEGAAPGPSEASVPLAELAGLEPDGLPCFAKAGSGCGPAFNPSGRTSAAAVEMDGALMADRAGKRWVDCGKLNTALGFDLVRMDKSGEWYVRHGALDPDALGAAGDAIYIALDALAGYCGVSGADEPPELGIEPGTAVSDKDRPVLDSVLGAIQENLGARGVVIDASMGARYVLDGMGYVRGDGGPEDVGYTGREPDGVAYDGRRVWKSEAGILIETDDGMTVEYVPEDAE